MKNKKSKRYIKNRIKGFFIEITKQNRIRVKEDEESPRIQETNDIWKKDQKNLKNPEVEGDQS
jgi:hypothetical protein